MTLGSNPSAPTMEGFKAKLYAKAAESLKEDVDVNGLQSAAQIFLEHAGIKPVYIKESEGEAFAAMRKRLNSEPGVIIANHPGYYDVFSILQALNRKDVKIVVSESNYKVLEPIIGPDFLIKSISKSDEAFAFLGSIREHVEKGGVVVLFPTGGADRVDSENPKGDFEAGFSVILRRCLRSTDMVYSFHINPDDIDNAVDESVPRVAGVVSALVLNPGLNINKLKEERIIRVNEDYSQAGIWQTIAKEGGSEGLAENFLKSFKK